MKISGKHFFLFSQWLMGLAIVISGCYPGGADYVDELDIVYTNYNPEFDFTNQNTFSLPDSVVEIDGEDFLDPDGNNQPDFIEAVHGGVFFEYQYELTPQFSVGIAGGVNTFYERKSYDTYTEGTVSLSGLQYRYTNSFPILLTLDYYYDKEAIVTPFAGIGLGTIYSVRDIDMGLYRSETDAWQFGIQPEVGILYDMNERIDFKVAGKYFQGFTTSELDGQSFFSLNVGLVFRGGY